MAIWNYHSGVMQTFCIRIFFLFFFFHSVLKEKRGDGGGHFGAKPEALRSPSSYHRLWSEKVKQEAWQREVSFDPTLSKSKKKTTKVTKLKLLIPR